MKFIELNGQPSVQVGIRRRKNARRLSLRVSQMDGQVVMSIPERVSMREARKFANEQTDWIRAQLVRHPKPEKPKIGDTILFQGQDVKIFAGTGRSARFENGAIKVPPHPDTVAARIAALLKNTARAQLGAASDFYAQRLGVTYGRLTLRDTRSRWGSCSSGGNLMYSWRLIMAPPSVLDYVAAHEVSHLLEMNHSPAYWAVVSRILPDYKSPRKWLRENGSRLHRVRFID